MAGAQIKRTLDRGGRKGKKRGRFKRREDRIKEEGGTEMRKGTWKQIQAEATEAEKVAQ